jgi:two-component system OmpR family sensor kinase
MSAPRPLRSRLLLWFLGAILLAFATSGLAVGCSRPEAFTTGADVLARNVASNLAEVWDDPKAAEAFVEDVRRVTGFEVRLVRDPSKLPPVVHRVARRGGPFAPAGPELVYVPIVRSEKLVGALEMQRYGGGFHPYPLWRLLLALGIALAVIVLVVVRVASELARPLERLGDAADRFGGGDLAFRTDLANARQGWVALEVQSVAIRFNEMAARVEATVRSQRELLGAISHEIRSPLGRARVALEIARDRAETAGTKSAPSLDEIEKQLGEVDAILGDLLAATRAGLSDLRREPVALVPWLEARVADEKSRGPIELRSDVEATVLADTALLGRAFHNVVANARHHGHPEETPLVVTIAKEGGVVRVSVEDRGPGFAASFLANAFEPFARGDAARARVGSGGSGLGLALVKSIAVAHGGDAFAENVVQAGGIVGAVVGFTLPVA